MILQRYVPGAARGTCLIAAAVTVALIAPAVPVTAQQPEPSPTVSAAGAESGMNPSYTDDGGGVETESERTQSGLLAVMLVTLLIWFGLFAFMVRLDRRVRRLEE